MLIGWFILLVVVGVVFYDQLKPLPPGISLTGTVYDVPEEAVTFLADRTFVDQAGDRQVEQQIFDEVMRMIAGAEQYVLVDMFLFNSFQGASPEETRALADELTDALVEKKRTRPDIVISVVSDPLNTVYGGGFAEHFDRLGEAGIEVMLTDLTELRDSNPLYSVWWRLVVQWFGNSQDGGRLPHPFQSGGERVTVRSWLSLFNFKANHRKLVVVDEVDLNGALNMATLVTSANPHDGSSAHDNVALKVRGGVWRDAIKSEQAAAALAGDQLPSFEGEVVNDTGEVAVQLLTEGAIRHELVRIVEETSPGDTIDMAMFYLSDRQVVRSLLAAGARGVKIRLVLDPNKDAFGRTKNGVPNRPVADELVRQADGNIEVRWCDTHGEQCHSKMIMIKAGDVVSLILGSANLTRRNIGDYNLETNILVRGKSATSAMVDAQTYFDDLWLNRDGRIFTTDYETYAEQILWKKWLYRIQEASGLSSF